MFKVLFIEDEPDALEDLPVLLKDRGLLLTAKSSIEEAMDEFRREGFDAVLLDICMPPSGDIRPADVDYGRETGVEVAHRLKKQNPNVPIIALTVVRDPCIRARMRAAGVSHIINKPSDVERIAEDVLTVIRHARSEV